MQLPNYILISIILVPIIVALKIFLAMYILEWIGAFILLIKEIME